MATDKIHMNDIRRFHKVEIFTQNLILHRRQMTSKICKYDTVLLVFEITDIFKQVK